MRRVSAEPSISPARRLDRWFRSIIESRLSSWTQGQITLRDPWTETQLGAPSEWKATIQIHRSRLFRRAIVGGALSIADCYIRGDWDCDDLTTLFRIALRNQGAAGLDDGCLPFVGWLPRFSHWLRSNTLRQSRRNIAQHYDLGNWFFESWLDPSMAYSSGIFPTAIAGLHEASLEKFDRVCRKLALGASDEIFDVGAGWGGFALYAASRYGCRVTATTLSQQQFEYAQKRIDDAGLTERVTLLNQDYRELRGNYDKVVSIEMIEAVGHRYLDHFFHKCSQLLRPEGTLLLQAIIMPEQGYGRYLKSVDFIQRYIFPGGCLPSLGAILGSIGRKTDLRLVHAEDFAPHYAETLRRWRRSFQSRTDDLRKRGCSDSFLRRWHYYLCYCEAAFEERYISVMQILFDKPRCRRDPLLLSRWGAAGRPGLTVNGNAPAFPNEPTHPAPGGRRS